MGRLRVIQWTTGKVGKLALRGILDDPRLELAGVYAWSADKNGQDAGTICGRDPCGVNATNDIDALLALGADAVIYTPFMADLDDVVRMLESGLDVISTNLFLNVGGIRGEVEATLEAACAKGGSSLYISGVNPGWINAMVVGLTAVCRDVQSVTITECADCSVYESKETWLAMGISMPEATEEVHQAAREWLILFNDAVRRIAEALHFEFDDIEFFLDYNKATERVDLGYMVIEKGTHGAVRGGWNVKAKGRTIVRLEVVWYLTKQLQDDWALSDEEYHIVIDGEPGIDTKIKFKPPEHWGRHEWDTLTAMPPVNALFDVAKARPGILGLRDVGLPAAPAGIWAAARG